MTTRKAAVALGAAALLGGQLPKIQPLDGTDDGDDDNEDAQEQPAGGLPTVAVGYTGNDDETIVGTASVDDEAAEPIEEDPRHLVPLGFVPIQFVISEVSSHDPITGATSGTPVGNRNTVSVMTVADQTFVQVWTDQQGGTGNSPYAIRPIVVGTSVDVEALEDAVRGNTTSTLFTLNALNHKYLLLAFGSPSTAPSQDDDGDGD